MSRVRYAMIAGPLIVIAMTLGCRDSTSKIPPATNPNAVSSTGPARSDTEPSTIIRFENVAAAAGVPFAYQNDEAQNRFAIIESMGGGVGVLDFDRDGGLDLWFPGGGQYVGPRQLAGRPNGLFRGTDAGQHFTDVAVQANAAHSRFFSYGVAVSDVDHDGFPDVLVTGYGGLQLFRNEGDGTFRESAVAAGLNDDRWSVSAAWGDLNGDQELDLYVAHYVNWSFDNDPQCTARPPQPRDLCPPRRFDPLPDTLYFGNGDGTFRDVSLEAGLRKDGKGLGVVLADFDADGDLDVYVANDTEINFLYRNDAGRLTDESVISGTAMNERGLPDGSMGASVVDFDGDGLPDIMVTNYEGEDAALYQNLGDLKFRHVSRLQGVSAVGPTYVGWGVAILDADLDGDDDVLVSNGHAIRFPGESGLAQRPLCYENRAGRLVNVAPGMEGYFTERHRGRGLATGDLDRDGRMDVVGSSINEPVSVLLNRTATVGKSLRVTLVGRASPREGLGATVTWHAGNIRQVRQVFGGGSYASASARELLFTHSNNPTSGELQIRWPSGRIQIQPVGRDDREITVFEPVSTGS